MVLIAENIHIISKSTKNAIINKDASYLLKLVSDSVISGVDICDLNIGPAKGELSGSMSYLTQLIQDNFDVNFSFDTSNFIEMKAGFEFAKNPSVCFLNSVCYDENKLKEGLLIAGKYNANVIALAFNPACGIQKDASKRLDLAFQIAESANSEGIDNDKIYFDPLVLPVSAAQECAGVVLDSIRMFKESFYPEVHTIVGLSNISNGSPAEIRPLINRVFLVLAMGAGLDSAIIDIYDKETIRIYNLLKSKKIPSDKQSVESLYFSLYNSQSDFTCVDDIEYDKTSKVQTNIIKTAKFLLNKEVYSNSYYLK